MSIAFDEIIRNGVIALPEHLKTQVEGRSVHVVISDSAMEQAPEHHGWSDIIEHLSKNPQPPFTPLTRDEANDRNL